MVDIAAAIRTLYPAANLMPGGNVALAQDAADPVPRIVRWDPALGPQPTDAQLAAVIPDYSASRIASAWSAADSIASSAIDHNSREQFILWLIDPTSTPARKAAIAQCLTWMAGIWAAYATAKSQIQAGNAVVFSYPTPCPFNFWQVAAL